MWITRIFILFSSIMATKQVQGKSHGRTVLKIYFLLMTLVGVIGTLISLGFFLYTIGKKAIITNDEYIIGERFYEIDSCNTNMVAKPTSANPNNYEMPTEAEKEKCKAEKRTMLIQSRQATFKTDVLNGGIRTVLFMILMLVHYPRFMKQNKKAE